MNESERALLMPFLRQLANSRTTPDDVAANNMIQEAVRNQPNANYLLVQRALTLESALATAERRIQELEGKASVNTAGPATADFLNPQTAQWGDPGDGKPPVTTSKLLYDLFIQPRDEKPKDLESRALSFIGNHTVGIWLVLLAVVGLVVFFKEKLV
jgi:hypothetical protein